MGDERSDDAERAWQELGLHLGFASTRPEKLYGTGPDNLWALSAVRQAVCKLKTCRATDTIAKKDMDQLGGSVRWLNDHNPEAEALLPVVLHPSRVSDAKATAVPGIRVVTPAPVRKAEGSRDKLRGRARQQPGPLGGRTGRPSTARASQAHR